MESYTRRTSSKKNTFLINKFGLRYDEVTASNLLEVDLSGNIVSGDGIINDIRYIVHGAIHKKTNDINTAHKMSKGLRAGTVYVNNYKEGVDTTILLGGFKQSGIGRDNSYHALDNYVQIKSTCIKLD